MDNLLIINLLEIIINKIVNKLNKLIKLNRIKLVIIYLGNDININYKNKEIRIS